MRSFIAPSRSRTRAPRAAPAPRVTRSRCAIRSEGSREQDLHSAAVPPVAVDQPQHVERVLLELRLERLARPEPRSSPLQSPAESPPTVAGYGTNRKNCTVHSRYYPIRRNPQKTRSIMIPLVLLARAEPRLGSSPWRRACRDMVAAVVQRRLATVPFSHSHNYSPDVVIGSQDDIRHAQKSDVSSIYVDVICADASHRGSCSGAG